MAKTSPAYASLENSRADASPLTAVQRASPQPFFARKASISRNRASLLLPRAEARKRNAAPGSLALDAHLKPVRGQDRLDRLRPFRDNDAAGAHLVETSLLLLARAEPEKIAMIDRAGARRVAVHQPVGRARHRLSHAERWQQPLREGGLAGAQFAVERDEIDRRNQRREPARQRLHRLGSLQVPHSPASAIAFEPRETGSAQLNNKCGRYWSICAEL